MSEICYRKIVERLKGYFLRFFADIYSERNQQMNI